MIESLKIILEEFSDKISEIYDLELAKEMTDMYTDLVSSVNNAFNKYWGLIKAFAKAETERDKLREELTRFEKNVKAIKNLMKQNRVLLWRLEEERKLREEDVNCLSKELEEERDARTQAESEVEWLRGELEEERRLRVAVEYDKELCEKQLDEYEECYERQLDEYDVDD